MLPRLVLLCLLLLLISACSDGEEEQLLLGATTSLQDPGLLDVLVEAFEEDYDYDVKPIVQGSGQVLELARQGEFDVIMTHSPADEQALIDDGFATGKTPVMQNYFQLVGPADDPADIAGAESIADAFTRISETGASFISRGDDSGTHRRELRYWDDAGVDPAGESWYSESAAGQGDTLNLANERDAYILVDSATFFTFEENLDVELLYRDEDAPNVYSVLNLNEEELPDVNTGARDAWIGFMTSDAGQQVVNDFGREEYGEALFEPLLLN
jgi:tungstate transport system substrate-binding protein